MECGQNHFDKGTKCEQMWEDGQSIQREESMRHILNEEVWKHVSSYLSDKELS